MDAARLAAEVEHLPVDGRDLAVLHAWFGVDPEDEPRTVLIEPEAGRV